MALAGIGVDVEGVHAVSACVEAGRARRLLVERGRLADVPVSDIVDRARAVGVDVEVVDDLRVHAATTAPQGLVARCVPIAPVSLEDAVAAPGTPALVVLDHVVDPRNVGAIARSAVACGMGGLVVAADRAAPLGATAFKAAAGTLERLPLTVVTSVAEAVRHLEDLGVWTIGLDGRAERSLLGLDLLAEPAALVVGAEGAGLGRLVAERVSLLARLPMAGHVESLNASVAASLAMYELARVRGWVG